MGCRLFKRLRHLTALTFRNSLLQSAR